MSTRFTKEKNTEFDTPQGYENTTQTTDFSLPPCTIEDVDKAVFKLFNEELPLYYMMENETVRVPTIFATGERFAILRRNEPLRDENNTVIIPLISILRSGISQAPSIGHGPMQNLPFTIKRRLSKEDPRYQRLINKLGFENIFTISDEIPRKVTKSGSPAGADGTRRETFGIDSQLEEKGKVLLPKLNNNIIETIEIPPTKYFQAEYEIAFWTQYTSQMNGLISTLMSSYQNMHQRSFRLETEKGYWFVGYVDSELTEQGNIQDFSTEERIIRYSFNMSVVAYLIEPKAPGVPSGIKSFVSAPQITFVVEDSNARPMNIGGPISGDVNSRILEDLETEDDFFPGQAIGSDDVASESLVTTGESDPGAYRASSNSTNPKNTSASEAKTTGVGGYNSKSHNEIITKTVYDEITGRKKTVVLRVSSRNTRKGETVIRGETGTDLEDIVE